MPEIRSGPLRKLYRLIQRTDANSRTIWRVEIRLPWFWEFYRWETIFESHEYKDAKAEYDKFMHASD